MPLSGLKFKKEKNPLSRRIQRLFEQTRADYLSAKHQPKEYTKDWKRAIDKLINTYSATDELASNLRQVIDEKELESDDAKNPES